MFLTSGKPKELCMHGLVAGDGGLSRWVVEGYTICGSTKSTEHPSRSPNAPLLRALWLLSAGI